MTIKEFRDFIQQQPDNSTFPVTIYPCSWRGDYSEVCFIVREGTSTKEEVLKEIEDSIGVAFNGWEGGELVYNEYTEIHFEDHPSNYSDDKFCKEFVKGNFDVDLTGNIKKAFVDFLFNKEPFLKSDANHGPLITLNNRMYTGIAYSATSFDEAGSYTTQLYPMKEQAVRALNTPYCDVVNTYYFMYGRIVSEADYKPD